MGITNHGVFMGALPEIFELSATQFSYNRLNSEGARLVTDLRLLDLALLDQRPQSTMSFSWRITYRTSRLPGQVNKLSRSH